MPKGYFDVLVPHSSGERYVLVDSREVDYLTPISNTACILHLKDGQRVESLVSCEGIQRFIDDARKILEA